MRLTPLRMCRNGYSIRYLATKRIFDVASSLCASAILMPFLPFVALLIKLDSPGPVFFKQKRLGRNGVPFWIYKLRTMADKAPEIRNPDGSQYVGESDPRLTRLGKFLRAWSIDELPQVFNVLRGDMSVVGPRPDAPGGVDLDTDILRKKRLLRPGLASLGSLRGRNSIPWMERVKGDIEYIENASLWLDAVILLKTVVLVVRRKGIYYAESSKLHESSGV